MVAFKQKFILINAVPYSMVDSDSGEVNEGISIRYLPADNLDPTVDDSRPNQPAFGYKAGKGNLPFTCFDKIKDVPGLYDISFGMSVDKDGAAQIKPNNMDFVSRLQVTPVKQ